MNEFDLLSVSGIPRPKGEAAVNIVMNELRDFEKTLNENQEVFISAGGCGFCLYAFRYRGEYVIMQGVDDSGASCRFVCNIHQLAISFRAVPKLAEQARRIGFVKTDPE